MMTKRVAILGATGSIGTQTIDVINKSNGDFTITAITANNNIELLADLVNKNKPQYVGITDVDSYKEYKSYYSHSNVKLCGGSDALSIISTIEGVDIVVVAVVGIAGLIATINAIDAGKTVLLANKEVLVSGGQLVNDRIKQSNGIFLPVDSEHSAILQCLQGNKKEQIKRLILTASGGPFRGYDNQQLKKVTLQQALRHPNWNMGSKITIDSSTLMNKGLEVIEAKWLFDIDIEKIDVIIHPQSIIHSMVEFNDNSIIAQLGEPDMRIPIQYALYYPNRIHDIGKELDLLECPPLTFEKPDYDNFPCLRLAYESIKIGGSVPAVLNAANEAAVDLFLNKKISYQQIPKIIEKAIEKHKKVINPQLEDIINIDREIKNMIYKGCYNK